MSEDKLRGVTPIGVVVYPWLFQKASFAGDDNTDDKKRHYMVNLVFGPRVDLSAMRAAAKTAWVRKFGPRVVPSPMDYNPFIPVQHQKWAEVFPEGCTTIRLKSEYAPGVIGPDKQEITEHDQEIYSGCFGRATWEVTAWENRGKRGLTFWLNNFQKMKDGEELELGANRDAAEDFDTFDRSSNGLDVDA